MREIKRLTALALACLLVFTVSCGNVFAASMQEHQEETEGLESSMEYDADTAVPEDSTEEQSDAESAEALEPISEREALEPTSESQETQEPLVNYLVVEEPVVHTPGTQTVMVGIGGKETKLETAVLAYKNQETGQIYETKALKISEDFVLFQMEYSDPDLKGNYHLESITYSTEGDSKKTSFAEMGIDASFGVDQIVESGPDDVLLSDEEAEALAEETEMSIVALDEEGKPLSGGTLEEAMEQAGCQTSMAEGMDLMRKGAAKGVDATGMSSLVVVLDAGHGGSDPGTQGNGVVEKTVNLKIAQYCKAELEEYAGVKVYMTRTTDTYLTLASRAQVAINRKADLFVSLHNNANVKPEVNGASVYYPNSNYNASCGKTGKELAQIIQSKLTALGLADSGIHIRNSENGTKYLDGSAADYYGVIKRCKENGIPALIVEHAFISNASDAKNYLSTDAQLKKLGVADATGIAEYYGLKKGLGFNSIEAASSTSLELSWSKVNGITGYSIARSTSSGGKFTEVAKVAPAARTTWTDTGLTPGVTYYYKIRTYTTSGSKTTYGKYSSVASGTTITRPVISSIKSKNSKALVISWETVNNAANYEIYRATKKNGTYSRIATLAGVNRLTYTDTKIKAGKKYHYKIRSVGQIDKSTVYSDYSEVYTARTAKVPTGVSVKSQATKTLRISWKAEPNSAGYQIKRAESAKGKYTKIATVQGGSVSYYDDAAVKGNTTYYYKVQSFNYNGETKGVSGYGSAASGKTIKKTKIKKIESSTFTDQTISWKKVAGVDGYIIYQSTSKDGPYKKLKKVSGAKTTSYKVTNLTPGTRYYYQVRTRKKVNGKVGYGSYSAVCDAWTGIAPKIVSVKGITGTSLEVSWNPVGGAVGYDIYRSASAGGNYKKIAHTQAADTRYTDSNLMMTQQYYYKIDAHISGYNSTKTTTTGQGAALGGSPISVTSITSAAMNPQGKLAIAWNAVQNVTGYQIYRSTEQNGVYTLLHTITNPAVTTYIDDTAVDNTAYYYKIVLINRYNNQTIYGPYSAAASGVKETVSGQSPQSASQQ